MTQTRARTTPLPRLLLVTDRTQCDRPLLDTVAAAVDAGARGVLLREKDLPAVQRAELAGSIAAILEPVGGLLVVAGSGPGAAAVHLAARDSFPQPRPDLVGRSCHSSAEVIRAAEEGCDYVTVSPVFPSASKPGYGPPLGPTGLQAIAGLGPPAYALGGVSPDDVAVCLAAGASGVAVMGPLMRDPRQTASYLQQLEGAVV